MTLNQQNVNVNSGTIKQDESIESTSSQANNLDTIMMFDDVNLNGSIHASEKKRSYKV